MIKIDIAIYINKGFLQNINSNRILYRLEFGISNRATASSILWGDNNSLLTPNERANNFSLKPYRRCQ